MSTNFPTSLDALTNPTSGDTLNTTGVVHSVQHGNANDAIEALEAKVGADSSTDTTSLTYKVATLEGAASGYALTSGTLAQFAATTSLQLKGVISDETGSGALVFADTPTLVTPVLGVATATSINKVAITAPATSATLTIADGKTLTVNDTGTAALLGIANVFTVGQRISAITNGSLMLGNPTAAAPIHFEVESVPGTFIDTYNNTLTSLPFVQRVARGTRASPSAIASGDIIAGITGRGYHSGGAFTTGGKGAFYVIATESWTSSANGSAANVNTVAIGATTPVIRAKFDENGISSNFGISSAHTTQGVGYASGAGGTQTQNTNKSTSVTLDKITGLITMNNAALNANTTVSFTLTNAAIAATDTIILQHNSGGTAGAYTLNAQPAAGSATISVRNVTAGNLSEAIVIRFTVIKSVSA